MRARREVRDYLQDILDYSANAQQFLAGVDFEAFRANEEKILAVVRALEVVGEAAWQLPAAVRDNYPMVPWQDAIAMRNKLIHDYFGVDLEVVWNTVHEDLPPLREAISRMLTDLEQKSGQ